MHLETVDTFLQSVGVVFIDFLLLWYPFNAQNNTK